MTAANHPTPSARAVEALGEPVKAALRHLPIEPVAPLIAANDSLQLVHPTTNAPQPVKKADLPTHNQAENPLVLPAQWPARMLLLSADSGIETTMSMLRDLQARNYQGDVVLLHVCRNPAELNQAKALQSAADNFPELSLLVHFEDRAGQFTADALKLAVPDVHERTTWMCGASSFTSMVQAYWRTQGLTTPLHSGRGVTHLDHSASPETVTA